MWRQNIVQDGDMHYWLLVPLVGWYFLYWFVHCSYGIHSKVEKKACVDEVGGMGNKENNGLSGGNGFVDSNPLRSLPRKPSHPSHLFDPSNPLERF